MIIKEENQTLLRVIAVVVPIGRNVTTTEVMDIIIIREKERVAVFLAVKIVNTFYKNFNTKFNKAHLTII
ncbi:hypothetical protein PMEGAPR236_51190 [Priestia megaterium]